MATPNRKQSKLPIDGVVRVGAFVLSSYLVLALSRSIYRNYQFDSQLDAVRNQIGTLQQQNESLRDLAAFYQSKAFLERQSRERFNLKYPDENVLLIPKEQEPVTTPTTPHPDTPAAPAESPANKGSNIEQWWHFFFG